MNALPVTICVPAYNAASHLVETLESAAAQVKAVRFGDPFDEATTISVLVQRAFMKDLRINTIQAAVQTEFIFLVSETSIKTPP